MFTEPAGGRDMDLAGKLRDARLARGWSIEEVGTQLRLPARVIARVEEGDLDGLGAPIYRRGYLRSFGRLVGVPDEDIEQALQQIDQQVPALVATGVRPRSEYVIERYVRPATYIALTALIALPVVWWAASGKLGEGLAGNRFDLQPPLPGDGSGVVALPQRPEPVAEQTEVLRASLIAVPPMSSVGPPAPADEAAAAQPDATDAATGEVVGEGRFEAVLQLDDKSWVEVTDGNGRRVHQALRAPGRWVYRSDQRLQFTIGNSRGARLSSNGEDLDLTGHRSSNDVVRIEVFGDEG
jgi:cytoskeleton protein RodZ